ncbi:MAG: hypothetical protein AAGJ18_05170 [Bacteroidota bacterium]
MNYCHVLPFGRYIDGDPRQYGEFLDTLNSKPDYYSDTSPAGIFTECAIEQLGNPKSVLAKAAKYDFTKAEVLIEQIFDKKPATNDVIYYDDFLKLARPIFFDTGIYGH